MKNLVEELYPNRCILYTKEVCDLLGIHYSTLRRKRLSGNFPPEIQVTDNKIGFRKDLIIQYLEDISKRGVKK